MNNDSIRKNPETELPIPVTWRESLKKIADQIVSRASPKGQGIRRMGADMLEISLANIRDYPDKIGQLESSTWTSSIYIWMSDYWQVLLDLTNEDGEVTDLVLHVQVYESSDGYEYEIGLIYVP